MKFIKRPMIVEAVQWDAREEVPGIFGDPKCPKIETYEGIRYLSKSDWIVKTDDGRRFVIKDSIFRATYEPIDE